MLSTVKCGIQIAAWIAFVMVCAATVGPIWARPVSHLPADYERFAACAVLGVLFMLAYPKSRSGKFESKLSGLL